MSYFLPTTETIEEDFYDFLSSLVDRVPWATEEDRLRYSRMVVRLREVNVFGYMATAIKEERLVKR